MGHYASEMGYPPEPISDERLAEIQQEVRAALAKLDAERDEQLAKDIKAYLQNEHRQRVSLWPIQQMIKALRLQQAPKPWAERLAEFEAQGRESHED